MTNTHDGRTAFLQDADQWIAYWQGKSDQPALPSDDEARAGYEIEKEQFRSLWLADVEDKFGHRPPTN